MNIQQQLVVPAEYRGRRLDVALSTLLTNYSRSQLTQWLKSGFITLNGHSAKPKDKVLGGESIEVDVDYQDLSNNAQPEAIPLDIVFEDDSILIVNKPAGLVVHPGAGNWQHTLVNALLYHDPILSHLPRAGIVHRLDKDTTGLLLVAKTIPSYTHLVQAMQARDIQRHYTALVDKHVISGGTIETHYGRHPHSRLKMAVCQQGKLAVTQYRIRKQYQQFTLLDVKLMTGRTHQIRVHMAHINHPIVGDPLYNQRTCYSTHLPEPILNALNSFHRQALHAASLSFLHPKSSETLTFTAPLPDDFKSLLTTLDTYLV